MDTIILPNLLLQPAYYVGLDQPVNDVADVLDEQGKHYHALTIRELLTIADTFHKVCIAKTHTLYLP